MSLPVFAAGLAFVISDLFETSVLGSGVGWAKIVEATKAVSAMIHFMARMLTTRSGGLQTSSFPNSVWERTCLRNSVSSSWQQSCRDNDIPKQSLGTRIRVARAALNHHTAQCWPHLPIPPDRGNLHHVLRIEVDQLEPVFGDIGRREDVVLVELGD